MKRDSFQNLQRNLKRLRNREMEHIKAEVQNHGARLGYERGFHDGKYGSPMWAGFHGIERCPR